MVVSIQQCQVGSVNSQPVHIPNIIVLFLFRSMRCKSKCSAVHRAVARKYLQPMQGFRGIPAGCKIPGTGTPRTRTQLANWVTNKVVLHYMKANKQLPARTIDDSNIMRSTGGVQAAHKRLASLVRHV